MPPDDVRSSELSLLERLFRLIESMPEQEQRLLLRELETRVMNREKRKHRRKPVFMMVDYAVEERPYTDFIQDLSLGGVFIETCLSVPIGDEVVVTFPHEGHDKGIDIHGQVVRASPQGIGVGFKPLNSLQEQVIQSFLEKS